MRCVHALRHSEWLNVKPARIFQTNFFERSSEMMRLTPRENENSHLQRREAPRGSVFCPKPTVHLDSRLFQQLYPNIPNRACMRRSYMAGCDCPNSPAREHNHIAVQFYLLLRIQLDGHARSLLQRANVA